MLCPLELGEANAFVEKVHRHHGPVVGHKFSLGSVLDGNIVGVAIVGRPTSRHRDDGSTLEVTRLVAAQLLERMRRNVRCIASSSGLR
jgi:hypothetical protein